MDKFKKLEQIKEQINKCEKCRLYKQATKAVPGSGNFNAEIMLVGEAPGRQEDLKGEPFVGKAGKILDELLNSINLSRNDIFITNIVKHRPPNNRNPQQDEISSCSTYLDKQISLINPKIICCLGNFATKYILEKYNLKEKIQGISKIKSKVFQISTLTGKIKIIPLYHPAVATYNPNQLKELKDDFLIIKQELEKN